MSRRSALLVAAVGLAASAPLTPALAGVLNYNVKLEGHWSTVACADGDPLASCFDVEYEPTLWPGLGLATMREYVVQSGITDEQLCESQLRREVLVAPRGEIGFLARGTDCPGTEDLLGGYRAVVAGAGPVWGLGAYVGATGSNGTVHVRPDEDEVYTRFQGSIDVPGLAFDTTAPVFGAVPRGLRIRAARPTAVRYSVPSATDAIDGRVAASCTPRSGTRFGVGRTTVRCAATDASGNTAAASFVVTVLAGRR